MRFFALCHPAQLLFQRRNGEEFSTEQHVVVSDHMVAAIFDKAVDQVAWEMVEDALLGAQQDNGFGEKQQGLAGGRLKFVVQQRC